MARDLYLSIISILLLLLGGMTAAGQVSVRREFSLKSEGTVEVINRSGRVEISAAKPEGDEILGAAVIGATSDKPIAESDLRVEPAGNRMRIEVMPSAQGRVDLTVTVPERTRVRVETADGQVLISGDIARADVRTETGTIATDIPTDGLKYDLQWTASRPRILSDIELEDVKERSGGKFSIKGKTKEEEKPEPTPTPTPEAEGDSVSDVKPAKAKKSSKGIELNFSTGRGIMLINVPQNEVSSDLRERPLTNAAKAIIRSGDSILMEAIRRASPKYFGDYARTLPPLKLEPGFSDRQAGPENPNAELKRVLVSVTDAGNRAIPDLAAADFEVTENNDTRDVVAMQPVTAPFNLVLLLDVSGSVDNYVNFIRKAARNFINTVGPDDRVSVVLFNEDTKVLSDFTSDKGRLSESLDTFDAGGGTAYYDALAYTLADRLRPLKGERTAIVVLTDGDDNRSFLPFDSLAGSIQESGALIYPLYVPSGLIAATAGNDARNAIDPLRTRYMGLTSKASREGERLAEISGGRYYPITQLSQIQEAYNDIVRQLRTAYLLTFRSNEKERGSGVSPRLRIRVKRENAYVKVGSVHAVSGR